MTQKYRAALDLQNRLEVLVRHERKLLNKILDLINEAEMNRSYLELGYPSLSDWLFDHFKYSETSARRRIDAALLKRASPSLEEKIQKGSINLTNAARVQTAIRAEEARTQTKISNELKSEIIEKISGKSGDETVRVLMNEFPEMQVFAKEKVRVLNGKEVTVQVVMSNEDFELFKRAKELLSHAVPDGSAGKIFGKLCREFVHRKDPLRSGGKIAAKENAEVLPKESSVAKVVESNIESKNERLESRRGEQQSFSDLIVPEVQFVVGNTEVKEMENAGAAVEAAEVREAKTKTDSVKKPNEREFKNPRYIPKSIWREVFKRDQGCCQARDHQTGKICGSRYQVEVDHIKPFALGGTHELQNLRCLCAQHNRLRAEKTFGARRA